MDTEEQSTLTNEDDAEKRPGKDHMEVSTVA